MILLGDELGSIHYAKPVSGLCSPLLKLLSDDSFRSEEKYPYILAFLKRKQRSVYIRCRRIISAKHVKGYRNHQLPP